VAALVAHERAHLERHHALFRAGTSAAVLAAGIGFLAATLSGGTAIGIGVVAILAGERLLAAATARRTEFAADAAAARRRSPAAVIALLSSLPARSDERSLPRRLRSTHPSPGRRIAAIREQFDADGPHTPRSTNRRIYPAVGSIRGVNREGLAYGLLFAVPPAIGMTGFSVMATGGGLINPLAGLIGAATFGVIFAFVYVAAARGEANEDRSPGTI
jgi:predicted Zn-dependent protease